MAKFKNLAHALERGRLAKLTRLTKGVPNMMKLLATVRKNAQGVPVWFLVTKGAWESAGVPTTVSKSKKDVGLFQIIIKPGEKLAGYSWEQFKDPGINTKVFAGRVNKWKKSLLTKHKAWFSGPDDPALWGVIWLFGGIGSGATRYIMKKIGPGKDTFNRIVKFTAKNPKWFASSKQTKGRKGGKSYWGVQSPELVVFRILIAKRVMAFGEGVAKNLGEAVKSPPFAIGMFLLLAVAAAGGIILWRRRQRRRAALSDPMESMTGSTYGGESESQIAGGDLGDEDEDLGDAPIDWSGGEPEGAIDGGSLEHFDNTVDIDITDEMLDDPLECEDVPEEVCRSIKSVREEMKREKRRHVRLRCGQDVKGDLRCIKAVVM